MTTNSFGTSPFPKYDYEPVFTRVAARSNGLPMTARVAAVAAATGLAYYATSKSSQTHQPQHHHNQQQPSLAYGDSFKTERQFLPNRLSDTMRHRQK